MMGSVRQIRTNCRGGCTMPAITDEVTLALTIAVVALVATILITAALSTVMADE